MQYTSQSLRSFKPSSKFNPNRAGGIDNITHTILINCASALAAPLHHLFTTSLNNGTIPTEWKIHKLYPFTNQQTLTCKYTRSSICPTLFIMNVALLVIPNS